MYHLSSCIIYHHGHLSSSLSTVGQCGTYAEDLCGTLQASRWGAGMLRKNPARGAALPLENHGKSTRESIAKIYGPFMDTVFALFSLVFWVVMQI